MSEQAHPGREAWPPSLAEHRDKVCDSIEAAGKAAESTSQRPRIEDYLGTVQEPERSVLLRELLSWS
jgi:hypothetical protein